MRRSLDEILCEVRGRRGRGLYNGMDGLGNRSALKVKR